MPLGVVYTKSTSIWDDINPFIEKLVAGYKQSQETKWNNEWQLQAIADLENSNKPEEVNSFLEMQKIPEENLDIPGFTQFANDCMGMLAKKEMMFEDDKPLNAQAYGGGGVGATSGMEAPKPNTMLPQPTPVKTTKSMPDVKEFNNLYKYVSELPTGKVDWTNTLDLFKEKLESGRAMGSAAQQFLSMIMGQSMPVNQRQKVQEDVGFAADIHKILYETEKPSSDYERWKADPEGFAAFKAVGKEEEKTFDFEKFLEDNPNWEINTINSKGDVSIHRKDTTKKYDFKTWEEAQSWIDGHKQSGYQWKIDPQPEGFKVSAEKVPEPKGETDKLIPTYQTINTIAQDLSNPDNDYDTVMHNAELKYDLSKAKLPTKADQAKVAYDKFEGIILEEDDEAIDEQGMVTNPEKYMDFYQDYERFSEIYFKETGQILPKKYLSIQEAGKYTTAQWATGRWKGGAKPVRNEEGIPWSWQKDIDVNQEFYNEFQRTNQELIRAGKAPLTIQDIDWEGLAKEPGIDIERLKKLIMNQ